MFTIKTINMSYYKHPTDKTSIPWTFWGLFLPGGKLWGYYNDRDHIEVFRDDNYYPPVHEMFIMNVRKKWQLSNNIQTSYVARFIRRGEGKYNSYMAKHQELVNQLRAEIADYIEVADVDSLIFMRQSFTKL